MKQICKELYTFYYELLSKIDEKKTPFFGLQFEKLQEINLDTDPEKYFLALQNLSQISPSNFSLLSNYVDYYKFNLLKLVVFLLRNLVE